MTQRTRSRRLAFYPAALLILFFATMMSTVIYMAKCNEYQNTLSYYLNISRSLHNRFMFLSIRKSTLVRLINLCSLGFILFMVLFGRRLWRDARPVRRARKPDAWILAMLLPLVIEMLLYDPFVYSALYTGAMGRVPDARAFRGAYQLLHCGTQCLHALYLALGCALILAAPFARRRPSGQKLVVYLSIAISYAFIAALYENLFYGLPFPALWISRVAHNYTQYKAPQIGAFNLYIALSPLWASIIAAWLVAQLILNERLQQSQRIERSRFLGASRSAEYSTRIFTHYIKNQIVAIDAEIRQLPQMPDEYNQHLARVIDRLDGMKARIDELSHHMQGARLQFEQCNITSVLLWEVESHRAREPDIDIELHTCATAELIRCDAAMLREVFCNILTNAVESLHTTDVRPRRISVFMAREFANVRIRFADNGPGIAGDPEQVFTPFYSSKKTHTNWGVGLSFSRRIVEAHGGTISARNDPAGGAVFEIELPIDQGV